MGKRHERTVARRAALQILYAGEINEASSVEIIDGGLVLASDDELNNYGDMLVRGVESNKDEIDALLIETSENWALDRMPIVDRCILRLAVYEMEYVDVVPVSVSINEAVELAKDFGGEDESGHFVNGVLGRIARSQGLTDASHEAEATDNLAATVDNKTETNTITED